MDLETLVRQHGPLPAARVIYILRQVCESLEEAHARGPGAPGHQAGQHPPRPARACATTSSRCSTSGWSSRVATAAGGAFAATAAGLTPGTPAYMAPEMALGETGRRPRRSLRAGVRAYFLLTGTLVFEATSVLQVVARHINDPVVPPSQRSGIPVPPRLEQRSSPCSASGRTIVLRPRGR